MCARVYSCMDIVSVDVSVGVSVGVSECMCGSEYSVCVCMGILGVLSM